MKDDLRDQHALGHVGSARYLTVAEGFMVAHQVVRTYWSYIMYDRHLVFNIWISFCISSRVYFSHPCNRRGSVTELQSLYLTANQMVVLHQIVFNMEHAIWGLVAIFRNML